MDFLLETVKNFLTIPTDFLHECHHSDDISTHAEENEQKER